jgi:hypothetical protein
MSDMEQRWNILTGEKTEGLGGNYVPGATVFHHKSHMD